MKIGEKIGKKSKNRNKIDKNRKLHKNRKIEISEKVEKRKNITPRLVWYGDWFSFQEVS